jgi:hypothetical protein
MKMTDDELLSILTRRISNATADGMSQQDHKQALDYYLCRPRGDDLAGRSVVQSADVADMVHATMAQLLPAFTGDQVCEFEPDAEGDESQARLESDACNKVMMESSRGFVVFYEAVKDALILRNGVIKVWAEEQSYSESEYYQNLTPDQSAAMSIQGRKVLDRGEGRSEAVTSGTRMKVKMQAIDPINFYVDADADCILLDDVAGTYERKVMARGDLIEMDLDRELVEQLPMYQGGTTVADQARYRQGVRPSPVPSGWAAELVEVWESYIRIDRSGSGELELTRTLSGQGTLLLVEPAEWICYATGTALIQAHRWQGLSLYDLVKGVQDVKTATLRSYIDNLKQSRTAANSQVVNIDDLTTERPKGIVRVNGPIAGNIGDLSVTDMGPSAQALLGYMDKVRSERGGAALEMASGEPGLMTSQIGAQNVADVLTSTELLGAMLAKTLAETLVRSAFLLVHKLLRTTVLEPMTLRLADQWVTVDPSQWRARERINIKAGLSPGERRRKAQALEGVVAHQMQLMAAGLDGVLVSMPNIYATLRDWCSAQGIDAGERYFTDPTGQASGQAVQGKMQQQQQQQQQQLQMMQAQMQLEGQKLELENQKHLLDKYMADAETRFKYWKGALDAEIAEAQLTAQVTADLSAAQSEGRARSATRPEAIGGGAGGAGPM